MVPIELLNSVLAGVATLLAAVVAQCISIRFKKQSEQVKDEADRIAEALKSEGAPRRAAALEVVAQNLPGDPAKAKEIEVHLERLLERLTISTSAAGSVASAVENLISSYHEQALSQAQVKFWFSVVAATAGFIWILYAGMGIKPETASSLMKTLPGVVMDTVPFLFFRQASETRQRATEFYDRLRKDKQMTEAAVLVAAITDEKVRGVVQAQIALHMAGVQQASIDLSNVLKEA
jgi:hypothetical protein